MYFIIIEITLHRFKHLFKPGEVKEDEEILSLSYGQNSVNESEKIDESMKIRSSSTQVHGKRRNKSRKLIFS